MYNFTVHHHLSRVVPQFKCINTQLLCDSKRQNCVETSITALVTVATTLLRCARSTPMGIIYIEVGNILALALTTQLYAKIQPKLDVFDQ